MDEGEEGGKRPTGDLGIHWGRNESELVGEMVK